MTCVSISFFNNILSCTKSTYFLLKAKTNISQGEFTRRAEIIFSAKYIGIDEDKGNKDGKTLLDRIAAIPFLEWEDIPEKIQASC